MTMEVCVDISFAQHYQGVLAEHVYPCNPQFPFKKLKLRMQMPNYMPAGC